MKAAISKLNCVAGIGLIVCLTAFSDARAQSSGSIKVNENAVALASQLIREGHLIVDGKGAWREHKPSPGVENEFISRSRLCRIREMASRRGRTLRV